jgi:hypothetical protein
MYAVMVPMVWFQAAWDAVATIHPSFVSVEAPGSRPDTASGEVSDLALVDSSPRCDRIEYKKYESQWLWTPAQMLVQAASPVLGGPFLSRTKNALSTGKRSS